MHNVLLIGATGSLGQALRKELADQPNYALTLFSRRAKGLTLSENERAISDSVYNSTALENAMAGQDIVFVALSGDLPAMAEQIIAAMQKTQTTRLVFTSSMGIYGEVAGESGGEVPPILRPYRIAADVVENSGLDYTILRPGWFDNGSDTTCQITQKGEVFYGHDVSRRAIACTVKAIIDDPSLYSRESIGLYR